MENTDSAVAVHSDGLRVDLDDDGCAFSVLDQQVDFDGFLACVLVEILEQLKRIATK